MRAPRVGIVGVGQVGLPFVERLLAVLSGEADALLEGAQPARTSYVNPEL